MAKVSVIIPAFNCEAYIENAVRSVMHQTEKDLEIIVVNDGSTDDTLPLLQKITSSDARIVLYSQANSGKPSITRNVALSHATGIYITFLDGDDIYHPEKIARGLETFARHPDVDLVFSDMKVFWSCPDEQGTATYLSRVRFMDRAAQHLTPVGENVYLCGKSFYAFMSIHVTAVSTQTVMLRRTLLDTEPYWFREDMVVGEDVDLWFRLARKCRMAFIDEPLCYYRQRRDSLTHDAEKMCLGLITAHNENLKRGCDIFDKHDAWLYKRKIARNYFDLGYLYFRKLDMRQARIIYGKSISLYFCMKTILAYAKTFVPKWIVKMHITRIIHERSWRGRQMCARSGRTQQ